MRERRARIAAGATVVGLGALGAAALGTNHGMPVGQTVTGGRTTAAVTTGASGTAVPAAQAEGTGAEATRAPIVTRASGGAGLPFHDD